jgi:MerR family copper efflux transcriptional regulator
MMSYPVDRSTIVLPMLAGVSIPVACSLTAKAARSQLAEWHDLLAAAAAVDRVAPTEMSVRLHADLAELSAMVRLAQREKACCPFFGFTIRIEAETVALHICVPQDAVWLLDDLAPVRP